MPDESQEQQKGISRREFLKHVGTTIAATTTSGIAGFALGRNNPKDSPTAQTPATEKGSRNQGTDPEDRKPEPTLQGPEKLTPDQLIARNFFNAFKELTENGMEEDMAVIELRSVSESDALVALRLTGNSSEEQFNALPEIINQIPNHEQMRLSATIDYQHRPSEQRPPITGINQVMVEQDFYDVGETTFTFELQEPVAHRIVLRYENPTMRMELVGGAVSQIVETDVQGGWEINIESNDEAPIEEARACYDFAQELYGQMFGNNGNPLPEGVTINRIDPPEETKPLDLNPFGDNPTRPA